MTHPAIVTLFLVDSSPHPPILSLSNPARAVDRYGRELQIVARLEGGRAEALAEWMQAEGGAREYGGDSRSGWC